ncbi:outer membrane protein/outer membrane protein, adhesin transport system [Tistlia consotensis]|uniref:Outer membrane protein/outer membrane protein, adhesin transport system n=1 Tax=Tistlia consotensis USBA 355 TaxID=560819 RepID=A0A1Y6BKJ0_9PROT|nr:TolC family outer membrane protein [Tistlia consotensis]SMF14659.1 outer membrane protein/outer membrane protein, adhesin transport system [Tistlia consotensis USBA 355]SNR49356.1 outer membrane protein/outer membrane protein, adhesin transport system [Tistlia consotensis]
MVARRGIVHGLSGATLRAGLLGGLVLAGGLAWSGPLRAETLLDALATTYNSNPTLAAARAQLRATNEGVPQELSNWRPSVTVSVGAGPGTSRTSSPTTRAAGTDDFNSLHELSADVTVTQPLYRGGQTVAGTKRAEFEVYAQRARLASTEQSVLLDAATSFMDVWRDEAVLQLNLNNEQVLTRQLQASRDRFQVGEITRTDVAQSESRLSRATADRVQAEGNLRSSRATYQQVIGTAPGTLRPPGPLQGMPSTSADTVSAALSQNPDVIAAGFSQQAADRSVRQNIGALLPSVNLVGEFTHTSETSLPDYRTDSGSLLAELSVPLYQKGAVYSQVREAKQLLSQRRLQLDEARRSAEQSAVAAFQALSTARAQTQAYQAQVDSAQIALEGVRQENAVGARTVLDVLNAEQELLDAKVSLVGAQRDEIVAGFQVLSAEGRLNAKELGLPVKIYNPEDDYQAVRNKWFGLSAPGE